MSDRGKRKKEGAKEERERGKDVEGGKDKESRTE